MPLEIIDAATYSRLVSLASVMFECTEATAPEIEANLKAQALPYINKAITQNREEHAGDIALQATVDGAYRAGLDGELELLENAPEPHTDKQRVAQHWQKITLN